jgi:hypothetical protein
MLALIWWSRSTDENGGEEVSIHACSEMRHIARYGRHRSIKRKEAAGLKMNQANHIEAGHVARTCN